MLRLIISILTFLLIIYPAFLFCQGQEDHPRDLLKKYFEFAENRQNMTLSSNQVSGIPFKQLMLTCSSFLSDQNPYIRYKAIDLIRRAGTLSQNHENRQKAVISLLTACRDNDSGNSGAASSGLLLFHSEDFSQQAIDSIAALIRNRCFHYERMIRIGGFVAGSPVLNELKKLNSNDSSLTSREKWAVALSFARMGYGESLTYCLEKIKLIPVNDNFINYVIPDLVYIRQPSSVDIILREILSDDIKCTSTNPDKEEKIICAFRLIELVAPVIVEFPIRLTTYGGLDTEDFDKTLRDVRDWINQHESFVLARNIY